MSMSTPAFEPLTPERRRQQTREYLLKAATKVFSERGFHGASIDEVASAAGFTKGAVYSNFKNKEDLFLAVLDEQQAKEMAALRATLDASEVPPEERLYEFVSLVQSQSEELGGDFRTMYLELCLYALRNPEVRSKLVAFNERIVDSVARIIEEERRRRKIADVEPPEDLARLVTALFRGIELMRLLDESSASEGFFESVMSFVARGLVPPQDPASESGKTVSARQASTGDGGGSARSGSQSAEAGR
jgi:AcrR family transcriptional regulator